MRGPTPLPPPPQHKLLTSITEFKTEVLKSINFSKTKLKSKAPTTSVLSLEACPALFHLVDEIALKYPNLFPTSTDPDVTDDSRYVIKTRIKIFNSLEDAWINDKMVPVYSIDIN